MQIFYVYVLKSLISDTRHVRYHNNDHQFGTNVRTKSNHTFHDPRLSPKIPTFFQVQMLEKIDNRGPDECIIIGKERELKITNGGISWKRHTLISIWRSLWVVHTKISSNKAYQVLRPEFHCVSTRNSCNIITLSTPMSGCFQVIFYYQLFVSIDFNDGYNYSILS